MPALDVGQKAPDFTLPGTPEEPLTLSEVLQETRFVVLVFYPLAFSPVCTDELNVFQEVQDELERLGARTIGISVDSPYSQQAFAEANGITFPLLADFEPKGAVAAQYGVYRDENGVAERALFVVDSEHTVRYSYVSEPRINPGASGVLEALDKLQD